MSYKIVISKKVASSLLVILIAIIFWLLRDIEVNRMLEKHDKRASEIITNIVSEQAKAGLLMPKVILINEKVPKDSGLNGAISKKISTFLIQKYFKGEKINSKDIDTASFFLYPDSLDGKMNYTISKEQMEELKDHIVFLTSQIDKAIEASKSELNNQVAQLNRWVSIWIGLVGVLGVFIPIMINYKAINDLQKIETYALDAKNESNKALAESLNASRESKLAIENSELSVAAINTVTLSVQTVNSEVKKAVNLSLDAKRDANSALLESSLAKANSLSAKDEAASTTEKVKKVEKLLLSLNDVGRIKDIDASFLLYNSQPLQTLVGYLKELHLNLNSNVEIYEERIVRDLFRQLALRIYLIAPYDFIKPQNFAFLINFSSELTDIINTPFTEESYQQALKILYDLSDNIVLD